MTRLFAVLLLASLPLSAAVIHGVVLEQRSGYSLSLATVTLEPIGDPLQNKRTARTGENGQFTFDGLAQGVYVLKAARRGFLPMQYGQRRWDATGSTITLEADSALTVSMPMLRFGGITGAVRDANEVGIPDQEVAAYTSTQPPRLVAQAKSDDRGVFRIGGLEPGNYLIRTTGNSDEERSYIPTFSRQTLRVEEAFIATVYPDEDTPGNDVRPIAGRLFSLSGSVALPPGSFGVTVTLASDIGRRTSSSPFFSFADLPPGHYEIYAEATEAPPGSRTLGGYAELDVAANRTRFALPVNPIRETYFQVTGAGPDVSAAAVVRRRDDAGTGPVQTIHVGAGTGVSLLPGHWDVRIVPPTGTYVSGFSTGRSNRAPPQAWNDVLVASFSSVSVTLSGRPAAVHGVVRRSGSAVRGAPVFLEVWDPVSRNRLDELRETRADANGGYRFSDLAPGDYRILATMDYAAPSGLIFDAAGAPAMRIEAGTDTGSDLELWGSQ